MTFKSICKKDNEGNEHWYLNEFTRNELGTWYDSNRGIYLVPDIIIDAIANGYRDSPYSILIELSNEHPEILSDEYNDIRDVMLLDDWIYDEMIQIEQWLNDDNLFIIPSNCYIGFNEHHGDFGMWERYIDDDEDIDGDTNE